MSEQESRALNIVHPAEGKCVSIVITAGLQWTIDLTAFADAGEFVRIYNQSTQVLGYKFSANPVANISISAVSGPTACSRINANTTDRASIPLGMPHLHLQSSGAATVWISCASDGR